MPGPIHSIFDRIDLDRAGDPRDGASAVVLSDDEGVTTDGERLVRVRFDDGSVVTIRESEAAVSQPVIWARPPRPPRPERPK